MEMEDKKFEYRLKRHSERPLQMWFGIFWIILVCGRIVDAAIVNHLQIVILRIFSNLWNKLYLLSLLVCVCLNCVQYKEISNVLHISQSASISQFLRQSAVREDIFWMFPSFPIPRTILVMAHWIRTKDSYLSKELLVNGSSTVPRSRPFGCPSCLRHLLFTQTRVQVQKAA